MTRYEVQALDRDSWVIVEFEDMDELTERTAREWAESLLETRTFPATRVVRVKVAS
jgi:hypothetical protein